MSRQRCRHVGYIVLFSLFCVWHRELACRAGAWCASTSRLGLICGAGATRQRFVLASLSLTAGNKPPLLLLITSSQLIPSADYSLLARLQPAQAGCAYVDQALLDTRRLTSDQRLVLICYMICHLDTDSGHDNE